MMTFLRPWLKREHGSAAAEFGLLVPVFVLAVFAVFHLCYLAYAASTLHWTVEQSARCAVLSRLYSSAPVGDASLGCQTIAATQTYAASVYRGPQISPSFAASENTTCGGRRVIGSGTYRIRTGFVNLDVPVQAAACFPTTISASSPWS